MRTLGLIPARGGSVGIKNKNLQKVGPWTLIEWAAKRRDSVDHLVLSSDNDSILEHGRSIGIDCLERPARLATNSAAMIDVVQHALRERGGFEAVCVLQPTSPFRSDKLIAECRARLKAFHSVMTVAAVGDSHPSRMYFSDGQPVCRGQQWENRQALQPVVHRTGQVYMAWAKAITDGYIHNDLTSWVCVKYGEYWNIDEPADLIIARALYEHHRGDWTGA